MAIRIDWSAYPDRERRSAFTKKLTPETCLESAGVTIPDVKALAKTLDDDAIEIHTIEDVILKGMIIAGRRESFGEKVKGLERYYPLITSWMMTDTVVPMLYIAKCDREEAYRYFLNLTQSPSPMTARFAFVALMSKFLTADTVPEIMAEAVSVRSGHHLLMMGVAWLTATAYTKHPEETLPYFSMLDEDIRKLAKQKCRDSKRIPDYLKEKLTER
ncbi:MAG: hypothetical protein ACI4NM_00790 [Bullifex sp.]